MKTFARLSAALIAAIVSLFIFNAPADAHRWRRHCHHHSYHHHHWTCACHVRHHHKAWRYHHWRKHSHVSRPADDYATSAPSGQCKPRLEGIATGKGVFGLGSARARAAAIADFETKATTMYGASFGSFNRARGASWDCKRAAIITAKCVVTALPCQ